MRTPIEVLSGKIQEIRIKRLHRKDHQGPMSRRVYDDELEVCRETIDRVDKNGQVIKGDEITHIHERGYSGKWLERNGIKL